MKIKPVEVSSAPKYPDKYNEEIRRVLTAARPYRWLGTPLAAGMLTAAISLSLSGCAGEAIRAGRPAAPGTTPSVVIETNDGTETPDITLPTDETSDNVITLTVGFPSQIPLYQYDMFIPLFEYGEGTGAIGCVSIIAPVFMSEEEAFAIISAAFAEAGLAFSRADGELDGMNIPETNMFEFAEETVRDRYKTVQSSLMPDGLVGESNLPIVFVSTKEVETWHRDTGEWVSIAGYNIKKTAQTLAENNPDLVVFYDPVAGSVDYSKLWDLEQNEGESEEDYISRWEAAANEASQAARDESERLLRLQVEAFVDWLWSVG